MVCLGFLVKFLFKKKWKKFTFAHQTSMWPSLGPYNNLITKSHIKKRIPKWNLLKTMGKNLQQSTNARIRCNNW